MKNLFLIIVLTLMSFTFALAKPGNYAGNWTLDKEKSTTLPSYYANVKSHKLAITQDEKTLKVSVEITNEQPEPSKFNFIYNLDGTETQTESQIRTPDGLKNFPTTLKAEETENGNLKITITREITMPNGKFKAVSEEYWKLSADGKTLTIHRADETPRGKIEMDMIFASANL